jgi:predicted anti-sigma-YlaC factor YlaD
LSDHIGNQAAFLASLTADDPERIAAEAHARECPSCRAALDEGGRLVRLVADAMVPPPPRPERLKKTAAFIESEMARERRSERALGAVVAGAVALSWIFQISLDYSTASTDPKRVAVSLSVLGVAIAAVVVAKSRRRLALAALIGTSGLLAHAAGSVAALEPKIGGQCTLWEIASAAIPWTVALIVARKWHASFSRSDMMAVAAGGALASQAAQHLTCPVFHADSHLLIFHFGGVILAMLLGALGQGAQPRAVRA